MVQTSPRFVASVHHRDQQLIKPRRRLLGLTGFAVLLLVMANLGLPVSGGYLAVDIFLVAIGFDLARGIRRSSNRNQWLKHFLVTKWAQIVAPMLLAVGLVAIYGSWQGSLDEPKLRAILGGVTMTVNLLTIFGDAKLMAINHLWVIAIIAQFTLVVPLLVTAGRRSFGPQQRAYGLIGAALGVGVCRLGFLVTDVAGHEAIAINTFTRLDGLLVGVALGVSPLATLRRVPHSAAAVAFAALLLLFLGAPSAATNPAVALGIMTPIAIALTAVVAASEASGGPVDALSVTLNGQALRWLGERAFSMYIWHQLFGYTIHIDGLGLAQGMKGWPGFAVFIVRIVFSLAAAAASHRYLEVPAMAMAEQAIARPAPEPNPTADDNRSAVPAVDNARSLTSPPPSILHA